MTETTMQTLYDRLGGAQAVSAAVDEVMRRVLADPLLAPFFERMNIAHLKSHQRTFVKQTFSAHHHDNLPEVIAAIKAAHGRVLGKGATVMHFDKLGLHFVEALEYLGVDGHTIHDAVELLLPFRAIFEPEKEGEEKTEESTKKRRRGRGTCVIS